MTYVWENDFVPLHNLFEGRILNITYTAPTDDKTSYTKEVRIIESDKTDVVFVYTESNSKANWDRRSFEAAIVIVPN
jgi:hypothetical protein